MPKLEAKKPDQRKWLKERKKYVTGFCNDINKPAQCEGTKPKSTSGKAMPTCEHYLTCPCICHYNIDMMFETTGLERKLIPNPEYVPERGEFLMPDIAEDPLGVVASTRDDIDAPPTVEHIVAATDGPATAPLAARRTPTGRAARGGLEAQVWDACSNIGVDTPTPKQVSEWIAEKYKIPTPSTGAVNAVWDRWSKLGFAEQAKKPNRFLKFTGEGTWEELARLKGSVKRQEKSAKVAQRLGRR